MFTAQDNDFDFVDPHGSQTRLTIRPRLSRALLCAFTLSVNLPQANAYFNVSATHSDAVLQWDGRKFLYHPPQNMVSVQACTDAALACVLEACIRRPAYKPDLNISYYRSSDGTLVGGVDWPFANAAGQPERIVVCHTGLVMFTPAYHTLCRYAFADNDFDLPEAYEVVCDALHSANGRAILHLDLPADVAAKYINTIAMFMLTTALIGGVWAFLHRRPSVPRTVESDTLRMRVLSAVPAASAYADPFRRGKQ